MKAWLKGGLIGLAVSIILVIGLFLCGFAMRGQGEGGYGCLVFTFPLNYALIFTGFEYFIVLLNIDFLSLWGLLISSLVVVLLGLFVGFIFDREISLKKKIIVGIVVVLIIASLLVNNSFLKYQDKKINYENTFFNAGFKYVNSGEWYLSSHDVCGEISVFNRYRREDCFKAELYPEENVARWKTFIGTNQIMKDCQKDSSRDYCIDLTAVQSNDSSICNYHINDFGKGICLDRVSKGRMYDE